MNRQEFVLAVLSSNPEHKYSPVQLQKLFFLIDKLLYDEPKISHFNFKPYHYGPFDSEIYTDLEILSFENYVDYRLSQYNGYRLYYLTDEGIEKGKTHFSELKKEERKGIKKLNKFVIQLGFAELVSAIYKEFPEMKQNSIFKG